MTEGYSLPRRLDTDPESLQRDLMKLVLTIIELVRQLMERQAIRRVDEGDLSDGQVEELGLGLMLVSRLAGFVLPTTTKYLMDDVISQGHWELLPTLALAAGATFENAARLANYAGGLVVMKRGTATVSASELRDAIRKNLQRQLEYQQQRIARTRTHSLH